jgi:hypothetical protein
MEKAVNPLKVFLGGLWVTLQKGADVVALVASLYPELPPPVRAWVVRVSFKRAS